MKTQLVRVDQHPVSSALGALAGDHAFVKETQNPLVSLYPLALSDKELLVTAPAGRSLLTPGFPVGSREGEDTLLCPTYRTPADNHALEIALL